MNKRSCYWRLYKQMCRKAQVDDLLGGQNLDTVDDMQLPKSKLVAASSAGSGDCIEVSNAQRSEGLIWW